MVALLGISEICCMIQRFNWYSFPTDKVAEKAPVTIYGLDKKSQKVLESWKWTFPKGQY